MRTRTIVVVWTLALVAAGVAVALGVVSEHPDNRVASVVLAVPVGLAFVATGLIASYQRPENRTGVLMILTGFAWFVGALAQSNHSLPFSLGFAFGSISWGFFGWLVLAFPSGRLATATDRLLVAGAFAAVGIGVPGYALFTDPRDDARTPPNAFLIADNPTASQAIDYAVESLALVLIAGASLVLVRRWRGATPPLRRALAPFFLAGGATLLLLAGSVAAGVANAERPEEVFVWLTRACLLAVPIAFLLGLLRTRLARAGVGRLLVELSERGAVGELRDALARAVGDPSLEIAYPVGEGTYADVEGRRVELPPRESGRLTLVEREGRCVAALVHDPSVGADPELVRAVTAAAGLALENERRLAALAESEARNRALLEAIPDLMFRISRDGTYLDAKGDDRDLSNPFRNLLGTNVRDNLPRETADELMTRLRRALERGTTETVEYRLQAGPMIRHWEGRIVASGEDEALVIVRDISERKRAEAQLQQLQDELHERLDELRRERDFIGNVVQASASLFCVVTPGGRVVRFNRALEELTGLADDDVVRGRPFWDVFAAPADAADVRAALIEVTSGGQPGERENRWIGRDGEEHVVAWSATQLRDAEGRPRILVSGLDITPRKRQEEELRRLYSELEERLGELRASRARIVEAADVERRRLERDLHDGAQQRLVSLALTLRLAEAKLESEPQATAALLVMASEQLALALEELRELARGIHPAVLTDRGLTPALEALATRAPLAVDVDAPVAERLPEPVEAAAYFVVAEALTNVAKYAEATSARVHVARYDGRAIVEVADDGVGGADPRRGSGLRGLADRVEALDGRLEIESAPGRGTTIRAEIPCA